MTDRIELTDDDIFVSPRSIGIVSHSKEYGISINKINDKDFTKELALKIKQQILKCQEDSKKVEKIKKIIENHQLQYTIAAITEQFEEILNKESEQSK